jgi:hypothetical protein
MTTSTPGGIDSGVIPSFDCWVCVVENCRRAEANLLEETMVDEAGSNEGSAEGEAAAADKARLKALPRRGARIEAIGVGEVEPGRSTGEVVAIKPGCGL